MRFKYDPNLNYQQQAIASVVRLFEGHNPNLIATGQERRALITTGNHLSLSDDQLLKNLQKVQADENLHGRTPLPLDEALAEGPGGNNFSVEMETGTGKTYIYLRTLLELHQEYEWRKFIIVVPSVAIREGVLSTLKDTREHFAQLYDNPTYNFFRYDSGNLGQVFNFATSPDVEIMVITLASFDKDSNIFNQPREELNGLSPLQLVRATRPVLVLDEPQNMEGPAAQAALESLTPTASLRYSATHRERYNLVYRLTPVDAYNLKLVKQIAVASVVQDHDQNRPYLELLDVTPKKTLISARLKLLVKQKQGAKLKTRTVRDGDDLYETTGVEAYLGYTVRHLNAGTQSVDIFNQGARAFVLEPGEPEGPDREMIARVQIRHTIRRHMERAESRRKRGVKTLSLFFIDEVASYTGRDGYIRRLFDEEFNALKESGTSWAAAYEALSPVDVRASYFSEYKSEHYMEQDTEAFRLIMQDKATLLSLDNEKEFIFSHSALREGWDNPNIFQLCTLRTTHSEISKRQQIGRGLRLAVNQEGERITDDADLNTLVVVANESFDDFARRLQREYELEAGAGQGVAVHDDRSEETVEPKPGYADDRYFRALWQRIRVRTRYRVKLHTPSLVDDAVQAVAGIQVPQLRIRLDERQIERMERGTELADTSVVVVSDTEWLAPAYSIPDVPGQIADRTHLTRATVNQILLRAGNLEQIMANPAGFVDEAVRWIDKVKQEYLVEGVKYEHSGEFYDQSTVFQPFKGYRRPAGQPNTLIDVKRSIYPALKWESLPEKQFAEALDKMEQVRLFIKLPRDKFNIATPVGNYSPDWAIVYQPDPTDDEGLRLYLVRETKNTLKLDELREEERLRIECGKKHFAFELFPDVDYDVSTGEIDAPNDFRDQVQRLIDGVAASDGEEK